MDKIYKIYKINFPSGKVYIGQTYNTRRRWKEHLWEAAVQRVDSKLYRAMAKYKTTINCFSIIEDNILTVEEANAKEIYYIAKYNSYYNGYNSTLGGDSGFQPSGESHPRAVLTDAEILEIRQIRASKKYTMAEVWEFYKEEASYSGFSKIWNFESRSEIGAELNLEELHDFYRRDKRMMTGDKHFLSKITDDQVVAARDRYWVQGETMKQIYNDFKDLYSLSGFRKIILGHTFTNVPMPIRSGKCKKKKEPIKKVDVQNIRSLYKNGMSVMNIIRNYYPELAESVVSQIVHYKSYRNY